MSNTNIRKAIIATLLKSSSPLRFEDLYTSISQDFFLTPRSLRYILKTMTKMGIIQKIPNFGDMRTYLYLLLLTEEQQA